MAMTSARARSATAFSVRSIRPCANTLSAPTRPGRVTMLGIACAPGVGAIPVSVVPVALMVILRAVPPVRARNVTVDHVDEVVES